MEQHDIVFLLWNFLIPYRLRNIMIGSFKKIIKQPYCQNYFQPHFRVRLFFILVLANSTKMCYTYDSLNRVTKRTTKDLNNNVLSEESFTYDAAGNITGGSADTTFAYDMNNKLISFNGNTVSYDLDGNMLSNGELTFSYDSANRLTYAGGHTYDFVLDPLLDKLF